ncbi:hypothetical protein BS78_04G136800 [Paspalum vaginatum]|nr:hypothetical protein BS78_04G136800 [Paspalum vaginatum]
MLAIMSSKLQKQYEDSDAYIMIEGLRGMFENQARVERYHTLNAPFGCKLAEGSPVSPHVIKMIGHIKALDRLGFELDPKIAMDPFIMNFHMNGLDKTLTELHGMLKTAEDSIKKTSTHVMMVQKDNKKRNHQARAKLSLWLVPLPWTSVSTVVTMDIGRGTARSTWKRRKRRKVRLML